ncbi:MAG: formamidopyrimidine-DNA glycosylase [Gemmatimonadetes bacterium]|nr:formamidopyrimidine-DNA glycosylase [Gemmatimonadota bacterium]
MPELPDVVIYVESLRRYLVGQPLVAVRLSSPFVLRSVDPPIQELEGKTVQAVRRLGKRIVFGFGDEFFLVVHLMIAGRFRWRRRNQKIPKKLGLAAFDFPRGTLLLTEAGTKKRASIHVVRGDDNLLQHDPGGIEVVGCALEAFREALTRENHTLKRALTDPRLFSGIGNAYSDEILHAARLSPLKRTNQLTDDEVSRLHEQTLATLEEWTRRIRDEVGSGFPEKVTAFREGMAAHGRFGQPCPVCGAPIQRIVFAENETNYCARCQTGGKMLADRALSRLLKGDWPKTLDAWENPKGTL